MNIKKLFIVVNVDWFFISHRLPIALAAQKAGYDVTIVAKNTGRSEEIRKYGLAFINLPVERSGTNIFYELKSIRILYTIYKQNKPDILHHVTLKIAIYGSIAARLAKLKNVVNAISGLGYNFTGHRKGLLQKLLLKLMQYGFRDSSVKFIFQNQDDINIFKTLNLVHDNQISLIKGSGVNLAEFKYVSPPLSREFISILLPARVLYDKGIIEFISAALILKEKYKGKAKFIIAGDIDNENLAAINEVKLHGLLVENYIEWIGYQEDIRKCLAEANIVVLPSYREGLPKSLIEAAAIGRPIITTDAPGCKECVIDGYNGFQVPVKNIQLLAEALNKLIPDSELQKQMGLHSRILAEQEFDVQKVVENTLKIYDSFK